MTLLTAPRKSAARRALEVPHASEHRQSVERAMRHPQTLHQYVHELQVAHGQEVVAKLHGGGVEWEPGDGGSKLGTPRWTADFRRYVTGNDCDTTQDGDWKWPLRSSLFRLSVSRSGTDRLAAQYVWLLIQHRFHVRTAFAQLCGPFANLALENAAEAWAAEALRRWHARYVELPHGKPLA